MMQSGTFESLGWNFSSDGWRIIPGVSYPYLSWQFGGEAPTVISGKVEGIAQPGGLGVSAAVDGSIVASTYTGANGFYYLALDPRVEGAVLAWLDGRRLDGSESDPGSGSVARLTPVEHGDPNAHATGLDIRADRVTVYTGQTATWTEVATVLLPGAVGDLSPGQDGVPYGVGSDGIVLRSGLGLSVDADGDFIIDGQLKADGAILVAAGGSLTLADGGRLESSASGNAVILAAGDVFVKESDAEDALSVTHGRWLIFSKTPVGGDRGGLAHSFRYYGVAFEDDWSSLPEEGNGFVYAITPQITVELQGSVTKVYDGTDRADLATEHFVVIGAMPGDTVILVGAPAQGMFDNGNAGRDKRVTADLSSVTLQVDDSEGADVEIFGYSLSGTKAEGEIGVITARRVVLDGLGVAGKVYDGTRLAQLTGLTTAVLRDELEQLTGDELAALLQGDGVALDTSGAWAEFVGDGNVGTNKRVDVGGIVLTNNTHGNYELVLPEDLRASITERRVVIGGLGVADRFYDGTRIAQLTGLATAVLRDELKQLTDDALAALLQSDGVELSTVDAWAEFVGNGNAGTNKLVEVGGFALTGSGAGNYTLVLPADLRASIMERPVVIGGLGVLDKVYDGTQTATLVGLDSVTLHDQLGEFDADRLAALLQSDGVELSASGAWAEFAGNGNTGTNKLVEVGGFALTGSGASNYTLVLPADLRASITPRVVVIGGLGVAGKVYDGTQAAQLTGWDNVILYDQLEEFDADALAALLQRDGVELGTGSAWARFVGDGTVGENKPVEVGGLALMGDAVAVGNYELVLPADLRASITPAPLKVTVADAQRWFGEPNPAFTIVYTGFVPGEGPEVLSGELTVVTEAHAASLPGKYALVPVGEMTAENYSITLAPGVLTVLPRAAIDLIPQALRETFLAAQAALNVGIASPDSGGEDAGNGAGVESESVEPGDLESGDGGSGESEDQDHAGDDDPGNVNVSTVSD